MNPLDHEMRQIIAALSVVSNGRIYSYQPIGSKSGFSSSLPQSGDAHPPHVFWRLRYEAQEFDTGRRKVIEDATSELHRLRKRTLPEGFKLVEEAPARRVDRLLKDGAGIPLQEAAFRLNCAPSELLRVRKNNGRDPEHGWPLPSVTDPRTRALALHRLKLSAREIGDQVGVSHTQVLRWVREENSAENR